MPAAIIVGAFAASGAAAAVGAAVAGAIGIGAVSTLTATAIGVGIAQGTLTAVQGGSASDVLKSAVLGGALSYAGGAIGEAVFGSSSVQASDAVNKAISSGVSDNMINMAMTTSDPLAALNAAAGWTTSDPSYLLSIGYEGLVQDSISGKWTDVDTAARAQTGNWQNAADTGVSNASYVDSSGTYFNADGQAVAYTQPDGSILQAGQTAASAAPTVSTATTGNLPVPGAVRVDAGGTYFNAQNQPIGFTQPDGSVVSPGGQQLVASPNAPIAPTPAPAPAPTEVAPAPSGPMQAGPAPVVGPVAPSIPGISPEQYGALQQTAYAQANGLDPNSISQYLNQGYTPDQIRAAMDANPNGGWARSLNWGEMGAPGATPPSLTSAPTPTQVSAPVAPTPVTTAPIDVVSTGISDSAPGTIYNGPNGPEVVLDSGKTVNLAEYQAAQTSGAPVSVDGQVQTQYRVEVSGIAHTVEAPPPTGTVLPENTQLATQAQVDAGDATWDPTSSSWVTRTVPIELTPVVPTEIPAGTSQVTGVTVEGPPTYAPSVPVDTTPVATGGSSNIVAGTTPALVPEPYTPLTVNGQTLTPDQFAGAADTLTVSPQPVSPAQIAGSTGGTIPTTSASGAPAVSSTPTMTGGTITTYADGTTITTPPAGTPNPVATVDVTGAPTGTTAGTGGTPTTGSTTGSAVGGAVGGTVAGPIAPAPTTTTPTTATKIPTTPAPTTTTTAAPTQTTPPPGVNNNGSPAVTTTTNADGTNTTTYADGSKVNWGAVAGAVAGTMVTTPTTPTTGGYNYTYNPAAPLDTFKQPLATAGLNAGWINPTPMYQTTSPVQAQYYWGAHPYQAGPGFNAELYNTVPAAPVVPWGLQQPPGPFDVNTFIRQNITPQAQAAAAGTAPQYYAPYAPATPIAGVNV